MLKHLQSLAPLSPSDMKVRPWTRSVNVIIVINTVRTTITNVKVSVVCRNVKYQHFILATGLSIYSTYFWETTGECWRQSFDWVTDLVLVIKQEIQCIQWTNRIEGKIFSRACSYTTVVILVTPQPPGIQFLVCIPEFGRWNANDAAAEPPSCVPVQQTPGIPTAP